ncbi:MAG: ABC transporter substrate-binding protein [Lachnospiraceae bacterium]
MKKMKILTAGFLAAAMVMGLTSCGSTSTDSASSDATSVDTSTVTSEVTTEASEAATTEAAATEVASTESAEVVTIKEGVLMVGVEVGYPPMEYFAEDGSTMTGFDIEMAKAIAEKMGLEVEFVDTAWDGIFAGVDADKYDCIISSVSITDERIEAFNMSDPYVANRQVLVVPQDSEITSIDTLSGHSVAVQAETTADNYMRENQETLGVTDLYEYDKILNCFDDLKSGRADSVLVDSVVAAYYLGEDASDYKTVWENDDVEPLGICMKKGNDALLTEMNKIIAELMQDGTLDTISTTYFGDNSNVKAVQ